MNTTNKLGVWVGSLTSLALLMSACAPAPDNKIISGEIAAFAGDFPSTFVNGIRYDISNTVFLDEEGLPISQSALEVGIKTKMKCRPKDRSKDNIYAANLSETHGKCDTIEVVVETVGELMSVNLDQNQVGTMNIMGQPVNIKAETVFKSKVDGIDNITQLLPGMIVKVYGDTDGLGNISATKVKLKKTKLADYLLGNKEGVKVKGVITNLDTTAKTFSVRGARINYASAEMDLHDAVLANNIRVKVYAKSAVGTDGSVTATKVKVRNKGKHGEQGNEGQEMDIQGEVTSDLSGEKFKVNDQYVYVDSSTVFDGITPIQIIKGAAVEVKGVFRSGKLVATYISAGESSQARVEGLITDINPTGVNTGSIVVLGQTYIINNETVMLFNGSPISQSLLNLGGLDVNDLVIVDYYFDETTQQNIAVKVSRNT